MAITRWNPVTLSPVRDLFVSHDEFSRLFDSIFTEFKLIPPPIPSRPANAPMPASAPASAPARK